MLSLGLLVELDCGSARIVEFLLFVFDKDIEDEAIIGDEGNLRCDEVEDDERGLNNQGLS